MKKLIQIKYTIISFLLGLIPFIIITSIINNLSNKDIKYTNTLIIFGIITAGINSIYTYISINNKIKSSL